MKKLTDTQRKIYEYIKTRIQSNYAPTVREIGQHVGLRSTASVQWNLNVLEQNNLITRGEAGQNRTISLTADMSFVQVPVLGVITAGAPILAVENIDGYIPFPAGRFGSDNLFALKVKGESMIEAGIHDGDIIVARKTPVAANRDIVVALLDDEATVKRIIFEDDRIKLMPENAAMEPFYVDDVMILGKVLGLIRENIL